MRVLRCNPSQRSLDGLDLAGNTLILVDCSSGAVALSLPDVRSLSPNCSFSIVKADIGSNAVTISSILGQKISGQASVSVTAQFKSASFHFDQSTGYYVTLGSATSGGGGSVPLSLLESGGLGYIPIGDATGHITNSNFKHLSDVLYTPSIALGGISRHAIDVYKSSGASQLHFSKADADSGGYLTSVTDNNFFMSAGCAYTGSAWSAKSTEYTIIGAQSGLLQIYSSTGVTIGSTFAIPTLQFEVAPTGIIQGGLLRMGIGMVPLYKMSITGTYSASVYSKVPQFHIAPDADDNGMWLSAVSPTLAYISQGVNYPGTGGNWTAKATSAVICLMYAGAFQIFSNSSLTPSVAYSPTLRFVILATGQAALGASAVTTAMLTLPAATTAQAPINLATAATTTAPSSAVAGDVWINATNGLSFAKSAATPLVCADLSTAQTFASATKTFSFSGLAISVTGAAGYIGGKGYRPGTVLKTAAYTLTNGDDCVSCTTSTAAYNITLPAPAVGMRYTISKSESVTTYAVTVVTGTPASNYVNGALGGSYALSTAWSAVTLLGISTTQWVIIDKIV